MTQLQNNPELIAIIERLVFAKERIATSLEAIQFEFSVWSPSAVGERRETLADKVSDSLSGLADSTREISECVQDAEWARKQAAEKAD